VARTCRSRAAFSTALIGSPLLVVVVVVVVAVLAGAVEKGELREGPLPLRSGIVVRDMEQEEGLTTAEVVVVVVAESAEFGVEAAGFGVDTTFFCCSSRLRRSLASSARFRLTLPPSSSENIL
jgi:hypothetical protein